MLTRTLSFPEDVEEKVRRLLVFKLPGIDEHYIVSGNSQSDSPIARSLLDTSIGIGESLIVDGVRGPLQLLTLQAVMLIVSSVPRADVQC
jgi:hypothetical protein